jgi:FixJ family two-component response regulator
MQTAPKESPTESEQHRYAVIDDEPLMAQLVSDMLATAHVTVEVFLTGRELLKSANLLAFKGVILDLSLPDMDGFDLLGQLAEKTVGVPIVLMSGHDIATLSAAHMYGEAHGLKMLGALQKPFMRRDLLSILGLSA